MILVYITPIPAGIEIYSCNTNLLTRKWPKAFHITLKEREKRKLDQKTIIMKIYDRCLVKKEVFKDPIYSVGKVSNEFFMTQIEETNVK